MSRMTEIIPAAKDSPAHPHALLSTLMIMSISMHEDLAARAVGIMHRTRKVTKTVHRTCILEREDHHNGQTATLMVARAIARSAGERET